MNKKLSNYLLLLCCFFLFAVAEAATITVTSNANSGSGTLRNAVASASSGDIIVFSNSLMGQTITLTTGEIPITKNLTITGPGSGSLSISGNFAFRIFKVSSGVTFTISGLTLKNASIQTSDGSPAIGGCIYNDGNLSVSNCIITNNLVQGTGVVQGGGIYNTYNLTMYNTKLSGNTASNIAYDNISRARGAGLFNSGNVTITSSEIKGNNLTAPNPEGGGIYNDETGILTIDKSTISFNNIASTPVNFNVAEGGGLYNFGTATLTNTTVSSNKTRDIGGGIVTFRALTLNNCTLTKNECTGDGPGGGFTIGPALYCYDASSLTIGNTILAGNLLRHTIQQDVELNFCDLYDQGYNLIGVNESEVGGITFTNPTDLTGTADHPLDPVLGPLQNNGGLTPTHALLTGSPALDAGNPASTLKQDQRGAARPYNNRIDIGSFEFQAAFPVVTITSPASGATFNAPANINIQATATGAGEGAYFKISNPSGGYRKFKLGYDSIGIYHGTHNVTNTGNNKLEITLRDFTGTADWTKIQIRPNGSTLHPLSLAPYVTQIGGVGNQFVSISIPLSDFDPSIDFTHLTMFELPYSISAAPFTIGIQKIIFTGGTTPFLWFGDNKTDNAHDGDGSGGQLVASLIPATGFGGISRVEFYNGNTKIGEDYTPNFSFLWKNVPAGTYTLTALVRTNNGTISRSAPITITVRSAMATIFSDEKTGSLTNPDISVYPNPVQNRVTISQVNEEIKVLVFDELGNVVFQNKYSEMAGGEADLTTLPSGIYLLKLEGVNTNFLKTVKLIKQ